ncbi:thioredoxin family protein [Pseudomonas trivialis]|uniref:Thioredoxin domain-containing protein n=1 Tax=Pseudomonas trivialis TaxID=200450 RepID=A0A0H5AYK0_9PSED|nr:thioredoxin family protein [Pseudomonas trivialis]AKS09647.1 hypothetical protein AA957_27210 [Pseudomonas trivialis]
MGIAKDVITSIEDYQSMLASNRIVFLLFVMPDCPPCAKAVKLFEPIADTYDSIIKSMVLETAKTPRLPVEINSTPTLVTYVEGKVMEVIKGFGSWETQEQTLTEIFRRYARQRAPGEPA